MRESPIDKRRRIFTERRRAPRFWRRFGGAIIGALVVLMYFAFTGKII